MSCTTKPINRYTFMVDPGICQRILRQQFTQPPLAGYYEDPARGFDANFLDWAPTAQLDPAGLTWSSCLDAPHAEPCTNIVGFHPVSDAIGSGPITTLTWSGAFISLVCGNFSDGGGSGPIPQITGVKYEDLNGNGKRDPGEPGLAGWTINLLYEGKVVASTVTDGEGRYAFKLDADHLPIGPGTYQVQEVNQAGWVQSQAPGPIVVSVGAGPEVYGGRNFGNFDPKIAATGHDVSGIEGAEVNGTVATFIDPDVLASPGEYSAMIAWGDGSESAGVVSGSGGSFRVEGSHTYAEEGSYPITVKISDVDNASNTATVSSTATIGDAELSSACATPAATLPAFTGSTATFSDSNPGGTSSDFSAKIEWGDGTESSSGEVSLGSGHGPYTVTGSHVYSILGPVMVTTTITDVGGSRTVARCSMVVFVFPTGGGTFVIGDKNASNGTAVNFWGSQWWKNNSVSRTPPPIPKAVARFKGFAEQPVEPSCGVNWSADPGNSTPPPAAALPAYMGVIVTSSVHASGSIIEGDTVHIVVVKTEPGYQPDPGHPGTGTVIAQFC